VWQSVRAILSDLERLRADLDAMIEMKRHNLYKSLRIGVLAHADGSTEIILGNLLSYEEVCTTETTSREPLLPTGDKLVYHRVSWMPGVR
jgi:hypothetical protein